MPSIEQQLQPGERILYRTQPTRIGMYTSLVAFVILLLFVAAGWQTTGEMLWVVLGVLAGIPLVLYLLQQWIFVASHDYVLTDRRLMKESGIFTKRTVTSYLDKVNNVDQHRSVWGRIFGFGDLEVDTASETGTTKFARVPHSLEFQKAILVAAEERSSRHFAPRAEAPPAAAASPSGAARLRDLKALLDDGLISAEEYETKRKRLLEDF